ncbi:MAG: ATP-dependent DNA/RNA helicase [Pycnora praestabilis]|nr:MAG: ATP-dependent DNA/RNA helicase [Pycnora praestabilis]
MKRKLDQNDVPSAAPIDAVMDQATSFASLGLNSRILQSIVKENYARPTLVQAEAIPLALEGKDILARAKTGSGKTAAYLLPILSSILKRKTEPSTTKCTSALILVPTRELAEQVYKAVGALSAFCAKDIRAINLTQKVSDPVQRSLLSDYPDIVIATPARASLNINTSALSLEHLSHLVIDEADLVLSYGYDDDLQSVAKSVPKGVQTFLMSATLSTDVDKLQGLFCRNPAILKLEEGEENGAGVSQYVVKCAEDEKFLLIYVVFKLKLIKGKCIIFVGDIDRCYRLKLYLEQFGIKSCVLNSELPVNSRIHVVEEFNKNVYDIIIATDEHEVLGEEDAERPKGSTLNGSRQENKSGYDDTKDQNKSMVEDKEVQATGGIVEEAEDDAERKDDQAAEPPKKKKKSSKKDKEFGISRGIDFKNVACVLNFDLPPTSKSYTHRIGRTARAGNTGMALSFVIPKELYRKHKSTSFPTARNDEEVLTKITRHQTKKGKEVQPYHFDMKQVDAFRYRMNDALRAVTRIAIREARTRELRQELLKSEKLKRHFEENPGDLHHLRHDGELRAARVQPHLKHVPEYLMPSNGKQGITGGDVGFVGIRKTNENRIRKARMNNRAKGKGKIAGGKKADPLKTFNAKGRK